MTTPNPDNEVPSEEDRKKAEEIEVLAAEVHGVYCKQYEKNFGKPYRTGGDYSILEEPVKDYDRAFVRWHLERIASLESANARLEERVKELEQARDNAWGAFDKKGTIDALARNLVSAEEELALIKMLDDRKAEKKSLSDEAIKKDIQVRLRIYRDQENRTQQQLADLLGVTIRQVIRWEKGESRPTDKMLNRMKELHIL